MNGYVNKKIASLKCLVCGAVTSTGNADKKSYNNVHNRAHYCRACTQRNLSAYSTIMHMTPDDLYSRGYEDGKAGRAMEPAHHTDENYMLGYEDGKGDGEHNKPANAEFSAFNDPPEGFEFTGEKRVPLPYEYYLTKAGNAGILKRERKNNQTRHILKCSKCGYTRMQMNQCICYPSRLK